MTKRIVSGVFILTALGALGVILAGALSSGEQLIVRFLTAVIVAALGLYVISDLRLQADEDLASAQSRKLSKLPTAKTPMDSTAAFMATATNGSKAKMAKSFSFTENPNADASGSQSSIPDKSQIPSIESYFSADTAAVDAGNAIAGQDLGATSSSTTEQESAVVEGAGSPPSSSGPPPGEPLTVDIFPEQTAADEFAWPMPPSHPDSKPSVDKAESRASESSTGKPDGYRVEVTGSTPAVKGPADDPTSTDSDSPAPYTSDSWSRSSAVDRAVAAADYTDAPLAPIIDLRGSAAMEPEVEAAIKAGELQVVATLIEQGMLSTDGPITDREVRTMVYVAFTSNELRKLLRAGRASNANPAGDLGPVELFDPLLHKPAPARLYNSPHLEEAQSQLG